MISLNWDAILQDQLKFLDMQKKSNCSRTERDEDTYRDNSRDTLDGPFTSNVSNVGWKQRSPQTSISYSKDFCSRTERHEDTYRDNSRDTLDEPFTSNVFNVGSKQRSPQSSISNSKDICSRTKREEDTHRDNSRLTLDEPHISNVSNVGFKQHKPPPSICYSKDICSRTKRDEDTYRDNSRDTLDEPLTSKRSNVGSKQRSPQSTISYSEDICSRTKRDKDTYRDNSRDTLDEPLTSKRSNVGSKQRSPQSTISYSKDICSRTKRDEDTYRDNSKDTLDEPRASKRPNVGSKQRSPQSTISYSKDICSRTKRDEDTYRDNSRDTLDEPLTSKRSNVGSKQRSPQSTISYSKDICSRTKRDEDTYRDNSKDTLDEPLTSKRSNVGSKQRSPQSTIIYSKDICSRTERDEDTYRDSSRDTLDEPLISNGSNLVSKQHSRPSSTGYRKDSAASLLGRDEDLDGEPLEVSVEDPELVRKMMELRKIEAKIIRKKAALAHKKVEPSVKKTAHCMFKGEKQEHLAQNLGSPYEQSTAFKAETLKERVSVILQLRHPLDCISKVHSSSSDPSRALLQSHKDRIKSLSLSSDGRLQEDHPLKARVKALMKQRHRNTQLSLSDRDREVCDIPPPPPSRSLAAAIQEDSNVNKGFLRFLSVLNKGVDISLLNRIVNSDGEDVPVDNVPLNSRPPAMENKSDLPCRSESQPSLSEVKQQSRSRSHSGERTEPPTQEVPHNDRQSILKEEKNDSGDRCFGSHSRSKSPPAVEVKKPKVDKQHEHLKAVLRTLGLSLEVEEMSKLADRTQERLYGKKQDDKQRADHRAEQEIQQRNFHRDHKNSSCSRSISSSFSPSSPRLLRSSSVDSPERSRASERGRSRDGSRDSMTPQDGNQDSKSAQKNWDECKMDSAEISPHHHPYPENLDASAAMPYHSLDQHLQYAAYYGGMYNGATNSESNFTQGTISSSHYPNGYPYQQKSSYHSVAAPGRVHPYHNSFEDINLMVNADLSKSEGQTGEPSRPRCLQAVYIDSAQRQSSVLQVTNSSKRRQKRAQYNQRRRLRRKEQRDDIMKNTKAQHTTVSEEVADDLDFLDDVVFNVPSYPDDPAMATAKEGSVTQQFEEVKPQPTEFLNVPKLLDIPRFPDFPPVPTAEEDSVREQSEEVKPQPTEKEIKANLKKTLEAFNQKMKLKGKRPAENSLQ